MVSLKDIVDDVKNEAKTSLAAHLYHEWETTDTAVYCSDCDVVILTIDSHKRRSE